MDAPQDLIPMEEGQPAPAPADAATAGGFAFPTGTAPGQQEDDGPAFNTEDQEVSPEEQALYEQFVSRSMLYIHGKETRDKVLESMNNPNLTVHDNIGRTTAMVAKLVEGAAAAAGTKLPADVVFHGATEIIENLMEVGRAAGIFKLDDAKADKEMDLAMLSATKFYGEAQAKKGGAIVGEAQEALSKQIQWEMNQGQVDPAVGKTMLSQGVKAAVRGQQQ